eukprot:symbB.v1.2.025999.t1/scaffold2562.1/size76343/8
MRISRQRCQDPNGAKDARIQGVQNTLVSMASLCTLNATHGISDASQRELDELASVLQGLVSVFRLDSDCVAIVNGDVVTAQDDKGECHHGARRHWPLLFSAGLRPPAESSFWFGEFCHALAHRSTGPSHGAHHSRVPQLENWQSTAS